MIKLAESNEQIGKRIRNIRLSLGLTMEEFGKLLGNQIKTKGVKAASVHRWEKGVNLPTSRNLKAIADIAGISVSKLTSQLTDIRELYGDYPQVEIKETRDLDNDDYFKHLNDWISDFKNVLELKGDQLTEIEQLIIKGKIETLETSRLNYITIFSDGTKYKVEIMEDLK